MKDQCWIGSFWCPRTCLGLAACSLHVEIRAVQPDNQLKYAASCDGGRNRRVVRIAACAPHLDALGSLRITACAGWCEGSWNKGCINESITLILLMRATGMPRLNGFLIVLKIPLTLSGGSAARTPARAGRFKTSPRGAFAVCLTGGRLSQQPNRCERIHDAGGFDG